MSNITNLPFTESNFYIKCLSINSIKKYITKVKGRFKNIVVAQEGYIHNNINEISRYAIRHNINLIRAISITTDMGEIVAINPDMISIRDFIDGLNEFKMDWVKEIFEKLYENKMYVNIDIIKKITGKQIYELEDMDILLEATCRFLNKPEITLNDVNEVYNLKLKDIFDSTPKFKPSMITTLNSISEYCSVFVYNPAVEILDDFVSLDSGVVGFIINPKEYEHLEAVKLTNKPYYFGSREWVI